MAMKNILKIVKKKVDNEKGLRYNVVNEITGIKSDNQTIHGQGGILGDEVRASSKRH